MGATARRPEAVRETDLTFVFMSAIIAGLFSGSKHGELRTGAAGDRNRWGRTPPAGTGGDRPPGFGTAAPHTNLGTANANGGGFGGARKFLLVSGSQKHVAPKKYR